jgi:putative peptide zinc metalloprotease protein
MTIATTPPAHEPLRLLPGTELLGPVQGSGLQEPPHLVRRPDGQVVQLSRLLFLVAQHAEREEGLEDIAREVGTELDLRIRPDQVAYLLEEKLHPLGVVTGPDGAVPALERVNPIFGLRMRLGVVPPRVVDALAGALRPLFLPPVIACLLTALLAFDAWLLVSGGIGQGLDAVIAQPTTALALFAITAGSLAFHELGHATACRYGGGRPGAIGVGVFVVWPAFFTDVTDSYRLGRAGRLRTDLGGMYFNAIFSLGIAAAYLATGFEPLLVAIVAQHVLVVDQFLPWLRLDGYYVMADLIGVADLFARIGPVLRSALPRREADPRVAELKPWARRAVRVWVATTVLVLTTGISIAAVHARPFLERAWGSLLLQLDTVEAAGDPATAIAAALSAVLLVLPVLALALTYSMVCRLGGRLLAVRRARRIAQCPPRRRSTSWPRTRSRPTGST